MQFAVLIVRMRYVTGTSAICIALFLLHHLLCTLFFFHVAKLFSVQATKCFPFPCLSEIQQFVRILTSFFVEKMTLVIWAMKGVTTTSHAVISRHSKQPNYVYRSCWALFLHRNSDLELLLVIMDSARAGSQR